MSAGEQMAEGRKQKAGGVPEGWREVQLSEASRVVDCKHQTPKYAQEGVAIVSPGNIKTLGVDFSACRRVSQEDADFLMNHCVIDDDDMIMGRNQSVGVAALLSGAQRIVLGQDTVLIKADKSISLGKYLHQYFQSPDFSRKIEYLNAGSTFKRINLSQLRALSLLLPPLPEQRKIAAILSTWDDSIATLSHLLTAKRQQKRGLAEALLTGKKRLPGFEGEWEETLLKSIATDFIVPMRDKPQNLTGPIPWCRIEDFDGKYLSGSKSGQGVDLATVESMRLKVFPVGTLLVSCSANLGRCAIVANPLVTNQTFIGIVPNEKKVDAEFLLYKMEFKAARLNALSSGTTITYLSRKQFEEFGISLPPLPEQKAIASILSTLDSEIASLEALKAKVQEQKRGLMDELLTGRVRVKVEG